jgi:peptide/nickel transport system ATP-binding protein
VTAAIELKGLHVRFALPGPLWGPRRTMAAVAGVNLSVRAGETLGIVGESGCGKTTLARVMIGLQAPSEGVALCEGKPFSALDRRARAAAVQPVFQDPYASLNPRRSVAEIVATSLDALGVGTAVARAARVRELLDQVGLPQALATSRPDQLSGGQRQRVAIARALAIRPRVLICDEPTSALDVSVQAQVLNLLAELKQALKLTVVLVSHNLAVVEHIADRVAVMYLGRIVEEAPTGQLFSAPRHPYTAALLASALTPEPALGLPAGILAGQPPNPAAPPAGCRFHPRCPKAFGPCSAQDPPEKGDADEKGDAVSRVACHLHA